MRWSWAAKSGAAGGVRARATGLIGLDWLDRLEGEGELEDDDDDDALGWVALEEEEDRRGRALETMLVVRGNGGYSKIFSGTE